MKNSMNSSQRSYRWYNSRVSSASGLFVAGPADPGSAFSPSGGLVTGKMLGSFLFTRWDDPGTSGSVGGYINRDGVLAYPTATEHEPRYEYPSNNLSGLLLESSRTNKLYNTKNWSTQGTFGWTASQITGLGTLAATGPDGTTSAVVLTITSSSGHVTQARGAVGLGARSFTVWLRTPTGAGTVSADLTLNNFSAHTSVTVTETWQRFLVTLASGSVTAGIRIHGNGNVVHAYGPVLNVGSMGVGSEAISNGTDAAFGDDYLTASFMGLSSGNFVVMDLIKRDRPHVSPASITLNAAYSSGLFTGITLYDTDPGTFNIFVDDGIDFIESAASAWWNGTKRIKIAVATRPGELKLAHTGMPETVDITEFLNYPASGDVVFDIFGDQILLNSVQVFPYFPSNEILAGSVNIPDFDSGEPEPL